jgi:DNA polymerase-3 subunit alpha
LDRLLFVQGVYKAKNNYSDQMAFKIQSIELLSEILSERSKELKLSFSLKRLNNDLLSSLFQTLESHRGNKKLSMEVFDEEEKIQLEFLSRKVQVNIGKKLMAELAALDSVQVKLIS